MMARVGAEDDESFTFESAVRGHHYSREYGRQLMDSCCRLELKQEMSEFEFESSSIARTFRHRIYRTPSHV